MTNKKAGNNPPQHEPTITDNDADATAIVNTKAAAINNKTVVSNNHATKNNANADDDNTIMPLSTGGIMPKINSSTQALPSSRPGLFKKLTMSIGSIIGVSSPPQ